ncbi:hypothetical protein [Ekhidna sp.]
MIQSKPKTSILISIGLFLIGILITDSWLFYTLLQNPDSYLWLKLIFTPILLVIAIAVARKGYTSALRLTIGNNKLTYQYFLGGKKSFNISDVANWHEEVVKQKNADYKRLTIVLSNGKVLHISNQENSNYQQVLNYIKKKVKTSKK